MVSIPIKMYTATENKDISFNQLHKDCKSRIKQQNSCPTCDRKLEPEEIEKGYEYGKGQYVIISKEDLENIPLPSKGAIEITSFVQLNQIDPIQFEKSYYLEPDDAAKKPFALFMRAIVEKGMIAIAKVSIRSKERLCCLRPVDGTLVMETLLYPDEIRIERGKPMPDVQVSDKEVAMASSLIDLMTEDFDPEKYKDNYREALMKVIEAKVDGREIAASSPVAQTNVVDLMDALRASMETIKARKAESQEEEEPIAAAAKGGSAPAAKGKKRSAG